MRRTGVVGWACLLMLGQGLGGTDAALSQAAALPGQLPAGLWLPVAMHGSVKAGKTRVGTAVEARVTQRVPLGGGGFLDGHASLVGTVLRSEGGDGKTGRASVLEVEFTEVRDQGRVLPVRVRVLAAASRMAVEDTYAPVSDPADRSNPSAANWTTRQVGGDEVYRQRWEGPVVNTVTREVGRADYNGVYTLPVALRAGLPLPRAVGVFSTTARGLYGFGDEVRMAPGDGVLRMESAGGPVRLGWGDDLLVEVE